MHLSVHSSGVCNNIDERNVIQKLKNVKKRKTRGKNKKRLKPLHKKR